MNIGIWGHIDDCFAINLCNIGKDPQIWQSYGGLSSTPVKRLFHNMPYGVLPITIVELLFIKDKVKRR